MDVEDVEKILAQELHDILQRGITLRSDEFQPMLVERAGAMMVIVTTILSILILALVALGVIVLLDYFWLKTGYFDDIYTQMSDVKGGKLPTSSASPSDDHRSAPSSSRSSWFGGSS